MPGFDKQGPAGSGPMTGRQQGMCRRTKELPFVGGAGQGGRIAQRKRRSTLGEKPVSSSRWETVEEELADLRKQYQKASTALTRIASKIEALEAAVEEK
ncbi:MAG: DUF5320 domain-containing protein [Desulforhopalus sp.]